MNRLNIALASILVLTIIGAWTWPGRIRPEETSVYYQHSVDSFYPSNEEHKMMALLYMQASAEYRAVCYQTFALARIAMETDLTVYHEKRAVVFDIDETVLDNSPYEAAGVLGGFGYPMCWDTWCLKAEAEAVPGVVDFIEFVKSKGVEVFYITNRKEHFRMATKENLKKIGLGIIDDDHLLMRTSTSSKVERREYVARSYHICLLVGDNLADFDGVFEEGSSIERMQVVDSLENEFGSRFIVLPNPLYGNWETALYRNSDDNRRDLRFRSLKPIDCD